MHDLVTFQIGGTEQSEELQLEQSRSSTLVGGGVRGGGASDTQSVHGY